VNFKGQIMLDELFQVVFEADKILKKKIQQVEEQVEVHLSEKE
jgi:hypothetical protein